MAKTQPGTGAIQQVRGIAHALLTARDHHLCVSTADSLCRKLYRLQPRATDQIDRGGRGTDGQSGGDSRLTCRVLSAACRQHLPKNQFVCVTCRKRALLKQAAHRDSTKFNGGKGRERTAKTANRRSRCPDYHDVFHVESSAKAHFANVVRHDDFSGSFADDLVNADAGGVFTQNERTVFNFQQGQVG